MKNFEKFKTAEDRVYAFHKFCQCRDCSECPLEKQNKFFALADCCMAFWLELEAEEEKPLPCPFCAGEVVVGETSHQGQKRLYQVWCKNLKQCDYNGAKKSTALEAIAAHNQVAKAVMESKKEAANV